MKNSKKAVIIITVALIMFAWCMADLFFWTKKDFSIGPSAIHPYLSFYMIWGFFSISVIAGARLLRDWLKARGKLPLIKIK